MKNRCNERVYRNHKWYQCKLPGKNLKLTNNTIYICHVHRNNYNDERCEASLFG